MIDYSSIYNFFLHFDVQSVISFLMFVGPKSKFQRCLFVYQAKINALTWAILVLFFSRIQDFLMQFYNVCPWINLFYGLCSLILDNNHCAFCFFRQSVYNRKFNNFSLISFCLIFQTLRSLYYDVIQYLQSRICFCFICIKMFG